MYKGDSWTHSPDLLELDEQRERKITVSIVFEEEWTTLSLSPISPKEACLEFIRNKYGKSAKGRIRGKPLSDIKVGDQDVIVVSKDRTERIPWVGVHFKWGDTICDQSLQIDTSIGAVISAIEHLFQRAVKRRQIQISDEHIFTEGETIEIEDEEIIVLEAPDLGYKVRMQGKNPKDALRMIKNIWWPKPNEEQELLERIEWGLERGTIDVGDLALRPGPITRELIGRFWTGVMRWIEGDRGVALANRERLMEIWNLDKTGMETILFSEWKLIRETDEGYLVRHETLRQYMSLDDWEMIRKRALPRVQAWVVDDREHMLFLTATATKDIIAAQMSEQLGYTVCAEGILKMNGAPWDGYWNEYQKLIIVDYWRWTVV
jgi:hypothetical protein